MPSGLQRTGMRKKIGRRSRPPRRETLGAFSLIPPADNAPKTWPRANPTIALPRAISRHQYKAAARLKAKGGSAYLKQWGSRPGALA